MRRIAGIDVGGTFTDLLLVETGAEGVSVRLAKVPTTAENQADGVLAALDAAGAEVAALDLIVHGTTATTNAVLERKVARTGLITTEGFRDVLELGRRTRPRPYGLFGRFEPLIPRELRREVPERVMADGSVRTPLDEGCGQNRGASAAGCRLRVGGGAFPPRLRQPRPRTSRRRGPPPGLAQWIRDARSRAALGVPRV